MLATKQDVTAIAFSAMAAAHNLKLDDFSIVISGNSTERIAGLNSGNVQGAMLNEPYDLAAEAAGVLSPAGGSSTILRIQNGIGGPFFSRSS